ncbi:MAG: hypothetical protein WCK77_07840 [Verrucomicrobiota bacterium]
MKTVTRRKNLEAASIGAISLVSASAAHASLTTTDVSALDLTISTNTDGGTIYFDLDRSGSAPYAGFVAGAVSGYDYSIHPDGSFNGKPTVSATGSHSVQNNKFSSGALIGAEGTWGTSAVLDSGTVGGPWNGTNGEGYLGLRMSAGGSDYQYGWALLDYEDGAGQISLKSFGYESVLNQSIGAGAGISAIPEPGNMSMLAALLSGSVLLRSRRRMVRQDSHEV